MEPRLGTHRTVRVATGTNGVGGGQEGPPEGYARPMEDYSTRSRPLWIDLGLAFLIGLVGRLLGVVGVAGVAGASGDAGGAVVGLLLPAISGVVAGLVTRGGIAVIGTLVGVAVADPLSPIIGGPPIGAVATALACAAAGLGHATAVGIRTTHQANAFGMPTPPSSEDQARLTADLAGRLRAIDPQAPGSFEQATVLLRQVNEQLQWFGPIGPWGVGSGETTRREVPAELLRVQAELVEAARLSAIAAGARRVTISASGSGGGIDLQAVWGDPIAPGEVLGASGEPSPID